MLLQISCQYTDLYSYMTKFGSTFHVKHDFTILEKDNNKGRRIKINIHAHCMFPKCVLENAHVHISSKFCVKDKEGK